MPSSAYDSAIFRDFFGTPPMRAVFSDETLAKRYVEVEVALAQAEAKVGVIPAEAAEAIAARGAGLKLDLPHLKAETDIVGYPIVGVVHQLANGVGDAGGYVHW
jgi:3-carboxy-cis,cis-muconate cycloisomerase